MTPLQTNKPTAVSAELAVNGTASSKEYIPPRLLSLRALYTENQSVKVTATLEKAFQAAHYGAGTAAARDFEKMMLLAEIVPHDSSLNKDQQRAKLNQMFEDFTAKHYQDPFHVRCRNFAINHKITALAAIACVVAAGAELVRRGNLPEAIIPLDKSLREIYMDYDQASKFRPVAPIGMAFRPEADPMTIELNDYGLAADSLAKRVWSGTLFSPYGPVAVRYQGPAEVVGAVECTPQNADQSAPLGFQVNLTDPAVSRVALMQRDIKDVIIPPAGHLNLGLSEFHDSMSENLAKHWEKFNHPVPLEHRLNDFVGYLFRVTGKDIESLCAMIGNGTQLDPRTLSSHLGVVGGDSANELVCGVLHKAGYSAAMNYGYALERIGINSFQSSLAASEVLVNTKQGLLRYDASQRVLDAFQDLVFTDEDRTLLEGLARRAIEAHNKQLRFQYLAEIGKVLEELLLSDKYSGYRVERTHTWSKTESEQLRRDARDRAIEYVHEQSGGAPSERRFSFHSTSTPTMSDVFKTLLVAAGLLAIMIAANRANRRRITRKVLDLYEKTKEQRGALSQAASAEYSEPKELLNTALQRRLSGHFYQSVNPIPQTTKSIADHILFYKCLTAVWLASRRTIFPTWPKKELKPTEQHQTIAARNEKKAKFYGKYFKDTAKVRNENMVEENQTHLANLFPSLKHASSAELFRELCKELGQSGADRGSGSGRSLRRQGKGELLHVKQASLRSVDWRRSAGLTSGLYVNAAPEAEELKHATANAYVNIDQRYALPTFIGTLLSANFNRLRFHGRVKFLGYGEKMPEEFDLQVLQRKIGTSLVAAAALLRQLSNLHEEQVQWFIPDNALSAIPYEGMLLDSGPKIMFGMQLVELPNSVNVLLAYTGEEDLLTLKLRKAAKVPNTEIED
jgi:hypothetical protein